MLKKALIRPLLIVAAFILGGFFPVLGEGKPAIRYILMVMLFFNFLPVEIKELKLRKSHFVLTFFNIIFPLAAWYSVGLSGNKELAAMAFFTAISPTASAAPVIMKFLGGSVSYVVSAFILSSFAVLAALCIFLPLLITDAVNVAGFLKVGFNLLTLMGVPCLAAVICRRIHPASREWSKKSANFNFLLWLVLLCIIAGGAAQFFIKNRESFSPVTYVLIGGISLLICAVNFTVGQLLGGKGFAREASQSLGQKNTSFTIVLAMDFSTALAAMGPTFYVLWHNLWNAWQLFVYSRRNNVVK